MTKAEPPLIRVHGDADLLREAVNFTAAETGFVPRLIEKDYFCTVLLQHLAIIGDAPVFKGGTCLAKVHAGLYRLSEDLDYAVSTPLTATRAERSRLVAGMRAAIPRIDRQVPAILGPAQTLLLDPLSGEPMVPAVYVAPAARFAVEARLTRKGLHRVRSRPRLRSRGRGGGHRQFTVMIANINCGERLIQGTF